MSFSTKKKSFKNKFLWIESHNPHNMAAHGFTFCPQFPLAKKINKVSFKPAVHTDETVSSTPFIRRLREIKSPPHSFGQVTESIPATFQRHDLRLIQIIFLYNKTMPTFSWITFNLQIHLNLIRIQLKIDFDKIKFKCSKNSEKNSL